MAGNERLRSMIETGASVVGATTGAILGAVTGDPTLGVGATAVSASGAYQRAGSEIADRLLGPREAARVGAVLALSAQVLAEKVKQGHTLRDDGFLDTPPNGRSDADEVLESVLRKAQTEYEERKLPYLSRLWANACIYKEHSGADLNHLVRLAEHLTYRDLTIISLVGEYAKSPGKNFYERRSQSYQAGNQRERIDEAYMVMAAITKLSGLDCVNVNAMGNIQYSRCSVDIGTCGTALFHLMELHRIPQEERQHIASLFRITNRS